MLDFRIYTFLEVCRHMNFTRAAESLNITQPTVSQHIRWLEEQYGAALFAFSGKKMSLTASGRQILRVATTMANDERILKKAVGVIGGKRKELRFGATLSIGETVVAGCVAAYRRNNSEDQIYVTVANTEKLAQMLNSGEIDFALVEGYFEKKEFDYRIFSKEAYVCVASPAIYRRLMADGEKKVSIESLLDETLLLREPGSGTREILEKNLKEKNLEPEDFSPVIQVNNLSLLIALACQGEGVTFLYQRAVRKELEKGELKIIPIEDFSPAHEWTFIWRKGSIFAPLYQEFLKGCE